VSFNYNNLNSMQMDVLKEIPIVGIYLRVQGDITGNIMFLLPIQSSRILLSMLMGDSGGEREFSEIQKSALKEIGNILASAYISSLATLTGINLNISVPALAIDMVGAILSVPVIQFGEMGDNVLLIETHFTQGSHSVKGDFFLIPDVDSFEKLLRSLGVV